MLSQVLRNGVIGMWELGAIWVTDHFPAWQIFREVLGSITPPIWQAQNGPDQNTVKHNGEC
jgi:hypothetical protein